MDVGLVLIFQIFKFLVFQSKQKLIGIYLFFGFVFPTLVLAAHTNGPVLLECETESLFAAANIEPLDFFRANKVFGYNLYDAIEAQKDAESICQQENCKILSCKEVRGVLFNALSVKCDFGLHC